MMIKNGLFNVGMCILIMLGIVVFMLAANYGKHQFLDHINDGGEWMMLDQFHEKPSSVNEAYKLIYKTMVENENYSELYLCTSEMTSDQSFLTCWYW